MNIAKGIAGLILILIGLYITVAVGGKSTIVACERVEPARVDCTTQSAPLGIPWGQKRTLRSVRRAMATDDEGLGRTFVLEMETAQGTVSLNGDMTVNEKETADRINGFLQNVPEDSLVVNYVDWGRLALALFFIGGFLGIYPGVYLLVAGFWAGLWRDLARRIEWGLVAGIACIVFGIFCLYIFGRITTLTCTRVERTQVDCRRTGSWARLIPLGDERTIHGVEGADVDRRRSSRPSPYRPSSLSIHLRLRTDEGVATAIECFTFTQARRMAQQINTFIADSEADSIQVDNFSWISTSLGLVSIVLPCVILSAFVLSRYFRGN